MFYKEHNEINVKVCWLFFCFLLSFVCVYMHAGKNTEHNKAIQHCALR